MAKTCRFFGKGACCRIAEELSNKFAHTRDDADAIRQANSSELGLSAGVWTSNLGLAHRMIAAIRAGVVHVNTYGGVDNTVPLGGFKQSGNGHDKSLHALDKFINKKTAWIKL